MRKNKIIQKYITKTGISVVIIFMIIFSISANAMDYYIPWMTHICAENNVAYLTPDANTRIQMQDIADDVAACAVIYIASGGDSEWTFDGDDGNDGCVTNTTEEGDFDDAAKAEGFNAFRLVHWQIGTLHSSGFSTTEYGIVLMDEANGTSLAHEVGHLCGMGGYHNTEGKTHRIMYAYWVAEGKYTLNETEAAHFTNGY